MAEGKGMGDLPGAEDQEARPLEDAGSTADEAGRSADRSDLGNSYDGAQISPQAQQIETYRGVFFDLLRPKAEDVELADIAHHLSMLCRYNGAVKHFYSVGEHSILVHDLAADAGFSKKMCFAALMHDAPEAYVGDVTSPLKYVMREDLQMTTKWSGYDIAYDLVERAICQRFDIDQALFNHPYIQQMDMWASRIEARQLCHSEGSNWRWRGDLPYGGNTPDWAGTLGGKSQHAIEWRFIERFDRYKVA